jgi:hypothetical protein
MVKKTVEKASSKNVEDVPILFESVLANISEKSTATGFKTPLPGRTVMVGTKGTGITNAMGRIRSPEVFGMFNFSQGAKDELADKVKGISKEALDGGLALMNQFANEVQTQIEKFDKKPSEFEVSFGIKVSTGVALIAQFQGEGDFSVKVTWDFRSPSSQRG